MKDRFTLLYKENNYNFEVDNDGFVWLVDKQNKNIRSNNGQMRPAVNRIEAEEIAKHMLYSMGF